eukprot:gene34923-43065_t
MPDLRLLVLESLQFAEKPSTKLSPGARSVCRIQIVYHGLVRALDSFNRSEPVDASPVTSSASTEEDTVKAVEKASVGKAVEPQMVSWSQARRPLQCCADTTTVRPRTLLTDDNGDDYADDAKSTVTGGANNKSFIKAGGADRVTGGDLHNLVARITAMNNMVCVATIVPYNNNLTQSFNEEVDLLATHVFHGGHVKIVS